MRYLIFDDNESFLEVARNVLEGEGLSVVGVASTGAEALRQLEALRPTSSSSTSSCGTRAVSTSRDVWPRTARVTTRW